MAAIAAYLNGSTGSDKTGIRKYLNDQGYKDDQITYGNGNVMLNGKNFYSATPEADGSTYASAGALQNALKQYNGTDITSKANNLNNTMYNNVTAQPFQFKQQQSPFSYDQNSDVQYQNALKSALANAHQASNNAQSQLGARGIGNSSIASNMANQIQQKAVGDVTTNVLPSLIQQAYQRYQDQNNNDYRNQVANYGAQQDQFKNQSALSNYFNGLGQQDVDNQYRDGQAADQQKQSNWNAYLQSVGLTGDLGTGPKSDYSLLGGNSGNRSLAGQEFDQSKGVQDAGLTGLYNGAPTMQKNAQDFGQWLDRGQLGVSQMNAGTSAMSARNSAGNANFDKLMDVWKATGKAPAGLENYGITAGSDLRDSKSAVNMQEEVTGLVGSLRDGSLTPSTALQQLEEDFSIGHYTKPQYDQLKSTITKLSPNYSSPSTTSLTKEQQDAMPSSTQLDKMVPKGVPIQDWKSWYQDPRGRVAGVPFENWQTLFGPRLLPKK